MKFVRILAIACTLLVATSLEAQRPKSASKAVPANLRPPAGMCRIWLDGVPAARQPAPTDCASALRNRPAKGQVIFGDDYAHPDSDRRATDKPDADSPLKGVAPLPKGLEPKAADSTSAGKKPQDARTKGDAHKPGRHKPDSTRTGGFGAGWLPSGD